MAWVATKYDWEAAAGIRNATILNYGGGDVTISTLTSGATNVTRGFLVTTAGTLACRFVGDDTDVTIPSAALVAGIVYPFNLTIIRQTGSTVVGVLLF